MPSKKPTVHSVSDYAVTNTMIAMMQSSVVRNEVQVTLPLLALFH